MSSDDNDAKLPDLRYIRELAKMFKHYDLDELEIETGETRMLLRRGDLPSSAGAPAVAAAAPPAAQVAASSVAGPPAVAAPAVETGDFITSPFVGTFYRSARPDADAFVEVGSKVQPGQAVCIVEAMKLFNEIESDFGCEILEVLTENGQAVEYGAKLFRVRKL